MVFSVLVEETTVYPNPVTTHSWRYDNYALACSNYEWLSRKWQVAVCTLTTEAGQVLRRSVHGQEQR